MYENRAGLGYQDFAEVRTEHIFYIDKTYFIRDWWEYADKVTLITRPRRFGKTLNMSMVECFFSNKYAGRQDLFEELFIWNARSKDKDFQYRDLQGIFPVIFLSFANIKATKYEDMKYKISEVITELYEQNRYLLEGTLLSENEKSYYNRMTWSASDAMLSSSLRQMSNFLQRYHGREVMILLDEYDTPMQEAWLSNYWNEAVEFFRSLFNSTFKTNPYLYRGLITGITRISKESIFSDLNNLEIVTTTSQKYATAFGFTETEVFQALENAGLGKEKWNVRKWYDGFVFGNVSDIYNPWSIVSFISKNGSYDTYWSNTSGNGLINSLIQKGNSVTKQMVEELLQEKSIRVQIDEQIVFNQLTDNTNAVWSLLLATGYLKVLKTEMIMRNNERNNENEGDVWYTLMLTNLEVKRMFRKMVKGWFASDTELYYNEFIKALLNDNIKKMNTFMNKVALNTFSSFDSGNKPSEQTEPERFYHGFVLGMVVNLSGIYKITSNRESGYGRYDVMLKPLDKNEKAFIFEFKVLDSDENEITLEDTLANAHIQRVEKQYEAELISEGF